MESRSVDILQAFPSPLGPCSGPLLLSLRLPLGFAAPLLPAIAPLVALLPADPTLPLEAAIAFAAIDPPALPIFLRALADLVHSTRPSVYSS